MKRAERIVVVCGATGRQGGAVARRLVEEGWKVRALTRRPDRVEASLGQARMRRIMADAMRFDESDRVVEFWTLSNDQAAVDAFIG